MRHVVGERAKDKTAASVSRMGRFETEILTEPRNLKVLMSQPGQWVNTVHSCKPIKKIILDMDKFSELPANREKLINIKLEIRKRTRGENENVYINQRIVLEDGGNEYDSAARTALAPF